MMDIDIDEDQYPTYARAPLGRRATVLPIDEKHPFDLEGYLSSYTGTCTRPPPLLATPFSSHTIPQDAPLSTG